MAESEKQRSNGSIENSESVNDNILEDSHKVFRSDGIILQDELELEKQQSSNRTVSTSVATELATRDFIHRSSTKMSKRQFLIDYLDDEGEQKETV